MAFNRLSPHHSLPVTASGFHLQHAGSTNSAAPAGQLAGHEKAIQNYLAVTIPRQSFMSELPGQNHRNAEGAEAPIPQIGEKCIEQKGRKRRLLSRPFPSAQGLRRLRPFTEIVQGRVGGDGNDLST